MNRRIEMRRALLTAALGVIAGGLLGGCAGIEPAQADASVGARKLKALPRKAGERVAVTIYEFRSSLPNTSAHAATDMFKTALVQSGQFRVVERSRLNEGVAREKQLQAGGYATGNAGQAQLRGAQYVFEGTLSETNQSEAQHSGGINVGGMQVNGSSNKDSIALDVRIVEAGSGDIVDAISVRKSIRGDEAGVSGVGNLIATVMSQRGKYSAYTPDVQAQQRHGEGVDSAMRAAIEEAVFQLAKRFER
jgi:curli biogenesis system outer membrane secretion channel CsgG